MSKKSLIRNGVFAALALFLAAQDWSNQGLRFSAYYAQSQFVIRN